MFKRRRQFIQLGFLTVGAAWLGTWLQSRLFPSTSATQEATPVTFPLGDLPVGRTKAITYGGKPVMVLRTPESLRAFSLICTHLGCTVQWQTDKDEFYCPCHDGRFDQFGDVLAGPRGQAWVASGKPGAVPDTLQALELLGVELSVDPAYFTVADPQVPEAEALVPPNPGWNCTS